MVMMVMMIWFWKYHSFMVMREFESIMRMWYRHSVTYRNRVSRKQRVRQRNLYSRDSCRRGVGYYDGLYYRMCDVWDIMAKLVGRQ